MKKFFLFVVGPTIATVLLVLKIPQLEKAIKEIHEYAPYAVYALLALATLINYYLSVISPHQILQNAKEKRWSEIDAVASKLTNIQIPVAGGTTQIFDLSFNIMVPKKKILCRIEPDAQGEKSFTWFPTVFSVVWSYGAYHVNSSLKFTTKQGSCGKAFVDEDFYGFNLEHMRSSGANFPAEFSLNKDQIRLTERIKMVASCPIVWKENGPDSQTVKILGVLNVECRTDKSGAIVSNSATREALFQYMSRIATAYSQFYLRS